MKKYVYAGLLAATLAATLAAPAFAQTTFVAASPDEPLHLPIIALCAALLVGVHAYATRAALPGKR